MRIPTESDLMEIRAGLLSLEGDALVEAHGLLVGIMCAVERKRGPQVYGDTDRLIAELRESTESTFQMNSQKPWNKETAFARCADMILNVLEEAFHLVAPGGRTETEAVVLRILEYYCVPKDGPDGQSQVEIQVRRSRQ